MKKSKTKFLILVTGLILLLCAVLPAIAAAVQDRLSVNRSGFSEMQTVKLDLRGEETSMPILGKLALLSHMEIIGLAPSQMSMTEEEVFKAAQEQMTAYEEAGIFQWFDVTLRSAVPKLGVDLNDANNFLVFWTVTFTNDEKPTRSLGMDIDDETGKILGISYAVYDSYSMEDVWKRNRVIMNDFTDIYFSRLDLTEAAAYAESSEGDYTYFERDGGISSALYSLEDPVYGRINLEFYVDGAGGFYLYLPN